MESLFFATFLRIRIQILTYKRKCNKLSVCSNLSNTQKNEVFKWKECEKAS